MVKIESGKQRAHLLFGFYAAVGLTGLTLNIIFNCDFAQGALIATLAAIILLGFILSNRAGLLCTLLSLTAFSWVSINTAGSWNYAATSIVAAVLVGVAIRYFLSRSAAVVGRINFWMLIIGLIAIIAGVFAFLRYSTFEVLPGVGYINQSVNVWGISSDLVIANILKMTIIYVAWGGVLLAAQQVRRQRVFLRDFRRMLLPLAALNALVAFLQLSFLPLLFTTEKWRRAGQATGLMIDGNSLGMVSAVLIAATPLWLPRQWYRSALSLITLVLLVFCIFASGSRTAFFLVAVFCIFFGLILVCARAGSMRASRVALYAFLSIVVVTLVIGSIYYVVGLLELPELPLQERLGATVDSFFSGTGINTLTNSRIMMWGFSTWMAAEHPLSGIGPGTFFCEVGNFTRLHGLRYRTIDNAMNLFLHLFVELGILACIAMIIVLALVLKGQWERSRQKSGAHQDRELAVVAFLLSLFVVFFLGPHITLPEPMFIVMLFFGLITGRLRKIAPAAKPGLVSGWKAWLAWAALLILVTLASVWTSSGIHPARLWEDLRWHIEAGFAAREQGDISYQWTETTAIQIVRPNGRFLYLRCWAGHESASGFQQTTSVYLGSSYLGKIVFTDANWKDVYLKIDNPSGDYEKLVFISDPPFVPDDFLKNGDRRKLGPAIAIIKIINMVQQDSFGFWPYENDGIRSYQWSKQEAYRRLDLPTGRILFHVRVAHHDVMDNPVIINLDINGEAQRQLVLKDNSWHKVEFQPEELGEAFTWRAEPPRHNTGFLHIRISRTWVPAEAGISDDNRILGVAVSEIQY